MLILIRMWMIDHLSTSINITHIRLLGYILTRQGAPPRFSNYTPTVSLDSLTMQEPWRSKSLSSLSTFLWLSFHSHVQHVNVGARKNSCKGGKVKPIPFISLLSFFFHFPVPLSLPPVFYSLFILLSSPLPAAKRPH